MSGLAKPVVPVRRASEDAPEAATVTVQRPGPYTFTFKGYDLFITHDANHDHYPGSGEVSDYADLAERWARSNYNGLYPLYRITGSIGSKLEWKADDTEDQQDLVCIITFGESGGPLPRTTEERAAWKASREREHKLVDNALDARGITTVIHDDTTDLEDGDSVFNAIAGVIDRDGFFPSGC